MSKFHRPAMLSLLALLLLTGPANAAGMSHVRDGWVYGLNLGWGWTQAKGTDTNNAVDLSSDWADDFTGSLRVGFAQSESFVYGLDFSGWSDYTNQFKVKTFWILATGTWYPRGQGFYVKGGVGVGSLGLSYTPVAYPKISQTKGGLGLNGGAGYEMRISPMMAVGLAYDYRWVDGGSISYLSDVTTATQSVTLSLTWYMD